MVMIMLQVVDEIMYGLIGPREEERGRQGSSTG